MNDDQIIGSKATLRAARELSGDPARAISLLRRPDAVKAELNRRGTFLASRLALDEPLRRPPQGATATLPTSMLLVLDSSNALRLFATKQKLHLHLGEEVMRWAANEARVTVLSGRGNFRAVEISYAGEQLLVASPWRGSGTQEALRTFERVTGGAPARPA